MRPLKYMINQSDYFNTLNIYKKGHLELMKHLSILISASKTAKEEMTKQQIRFFNIIGITEERALS